MVRSGAGYYHAGQDRCHGDSGDRPHPLRWPGPATELDNVVRWHNAPSPHATAGRAVRVSRAACVLRPQLRLRGFEMRGHQARART